jgi:predicted ATPase
MPGNQPAFVVLRLQRLMRFGNMPLSLDALQFDILSTLVEQAGRPVSEPDLLGAAGLAGTQSEALWESVGTINLVLAACGPEAGYVEHAPESGYALVLPPPAKTPSPGAAWARWRTAAVLGRERSIEMLAEQLPLRRFITIVGPGGIGKTTLALASAQRLQGAYPDGVHFVDLSPLSDGRLVPGALAAALGIPAFVGAADLVDYLRSRQLLILLDSCEHLLADVAALVESFLSDAVDVHVLATSREPLRAIGEWLHRVEPMGLPADARHAAALSAEQALQYPGIQLFVERARAGRSGFTLTDAQAPDVAQLCLKLDGIALAIELAAARVAGLGIEGLASQLEDRLLSFEHASRGPRAPQRHRTLEAMLDWSHELLSEEEQRVFRRLSVFRGNFNLKSAAAVASNGFPFAHAEALATERILDLVAKSLVSSVMDNGVPAFRMLDTTRAYARAKLQQAADQETTLQRHAQAMYALLMEAENAWVEMPRGPWRATYAPWVNDIRAALDWAYAASGEEELALQLTNGAFPLADHTALMADYGQWSDRALQLLPQLQGRHPLLEIRLRTQPVFLYQREPAGNAAIQRLESVLELAQAAGRLQDQVGPIIGMWGLACQTGDYPASLRRVRQMEAVGRATGDPVIALIAKRTGAQSSHYLGDHEQAYRSASEVFERATTPIPLAYYPSPVDHHVSMQIVMVRVLWLRGQPSQAFARLRECLQFAGADMPLGLCQVLALAAVPLALWCGDVGLARQFNRQLRDVITAHGIKYWLFWWPAYEQVLALRESGSSQSPDLDAMARSCPALLCEQLATFELRWLSAESERRVENSTVGWCAPEVWRLQGERRLQQSDGAFAAEAEALFQRALQTAREQGALAWELRAASSLSDLWRANGRGAEAHELLRGVRDRVTDAFETADLAAADARLRADH